MMPKKLMLSNISSISLNRLQVKRKNAVVNEYSDMVEKLDTEKSKMDAGMLWDTSYI